MKSNTKFANVIKDSIYFEYIPKKKVLSIMKDIEKRTEKLFNTTYIPLSAKIYNDNREKYEPMYIGREIAMTTLKALHELMEE